MNAYETYKHILESKLHTLEELRPHIEFCESLVSLFAQSFSDNRTSFRVSVGLSSHSISGIYIVARDVPDFESIVPMLTHIVKSGYRAEGFDDYPEINRRRWKYGKLKGYDAVINVGAFLKSDGAKCEFKQTGVKESPIYELVCK